MAGALLPKQVCRTLSLALGVGQIVYLVSGASGHEGGFISLYLSCEPTEEEKERAVDGKYVRTPAFINAVYILTSLCRWVREGLFKFSFELRK